LPTEAARKRRTAVPGAPTRRPSPAGAYERLVRDSTGRVHDRTVHAYPVEGFEDNLTTSVSPRCNIRCEPFAACPTVIVRVVPPVTADAPQTRSTAWAATTDLAWTNLTRHLSLSRTSSLQDGLHGIGRFADPPPLRAACTTRTQRRSGHELRRWGRRRRRCRRSRTTSLTAPLDVDGLQPPQYGSGVRAINGSRVRRAGAASPSASARAGSRAAACAGRSRRDSPPSSRRG